MLTELRVRDLGVIVDLSLVLGPGMTALTGETGAGKTLLVEAIELLVGGRADKVLVRPGADEAWVEARFCADDTDVVLARAVPAGTGRSRAYVDGRMAPVSALAEHGQSLVDLHGQHAHQSLLAPATQRAALDAYAGIDTKALDEARAKVREIDATIVGLGGDARARAREIDLLRFQLEEIEKAGISAPDELEQLAGEEERLASAAAARVAVATAYDAVTGDGGVGDGLQAALAALGGVDVLAAQAERFRSVQSELEDAARELRAAGEAIEENDERLAEVRARTQQLRDLMRKYGDTLTDVLAFSAETVARLEELESFESRVAALERERAGVLRQVDEVAGEIAAQRREAAPGLAGAIETRLRELALPNARIEVSVAGDPPCDDVALLFGANAGEPVLPLAKIASGGELARTMLAARLVLTSGPATLVFDEVDAGIGGAAAVAVGRALSVLARDHQVLVVTHLPQVAAYADAHVAVTKTEVDGRTVAGARVLEDRERVVELSRMLSGQPASTTARHHAEELLAAAAQERLG